MIGMNLAYRQHISTLGNVRGLKIVELYFVILKKYGWNEHQENKEYLKYTGYTAD